jgi:hypothetical protein
MESSICVLHLPELNELIEPSPVQARTAWQGPSRAGQARFAKPGFDNLAVDIQGISGSDSDSDSGSGSGSDSGSGSGSCSCSCSDS